MLSAIVLSVVML